jgi:hypothetical protein
LPTIGHGGSDAGYRSNYLRFTDEDVGIVCFCNFARANPAAYVQQVADIILEDELEPIVDDAGVPEVDLERWTPTFEAITGFYRDPLTDVPLNVFMHEGLARVTRGQARPEGAPFLIPLDANRYRLGVDGDTVVFEMSGGRPTALRRGERTYTYLGGVTTRVNPEDYLGTFVSDELGTEYWIAADSSETGLLLKHRKHDPVSLTPGHVDAFFVGGDWFVFTRDGDGRVNGFTWSDGRVRKVEFARGS